MKRLIVLLTTLCLLGVALAPVVVHGQGPSGTTWVSSFNVLNLDQSEDAHIAVSFYGTAATPVLSQGLDPLGPGNSVEVYVPSVSGLPDGRYSVVIYSDKPVACVAGTLGTRAGISFYGAYSGASEGSTVAYLPDAQREYYGWNSFYTAQNAGTEAADITMEIYSAGSATPIDSRTEHDVPAGVSKDFDLSHTSYASTLGTMFNGSAVVSSVQPLVVIDHKTSGVGGTAAYEGFTSGDQTVYIAELAKDNWDWWSVLKVQNIDDTTPTTVNVSYSDGVTATATLQPYESAMFDQRTEAHGSGVFSAVVDSTATDVVALGNKGYGAAAIQAQTYDSVSGGTQTALCPKMMRGYYGWTTSYAVMNLHDTISTTVTVTYSPWGSYLGGSYTVDLDAFETLNVFQGNDPYLLAATGSQLPVGYRGALSLESSATDIVGICNEAEMSGVAAGSGDWSSANAINR